MLEISQIRFICKDHNQLLEICGSDRIFTPTYGLPGDDDWQTRGDEDGWLSLDTSEMFCPECLDALDQGFEEEQNWVIEAQ